MDLALNIVLAAAAVVGTLVAVLQYRDKKAESARADRAELAQERTADELTEVREELAGSREAHEEIASVEGQAATNEKRAARDALSQQKKQAKDSLSLQKKQAQDAKRANSAALREQKRRADKEARERRAQDRKVLAETTKQRKAAEKLAKEARRKK